MADIISNSNLSISGPSLSGDFIPSIDNQKKRNGLGVVVPWGGGTAFQSSTSGGSSGVSIDTTDEITQLKDLILSRPVGDTISYVVEGIIGPPGEPGPAGPAGLPSPSVLSAVGGATIPTRILDDGATPSAPTGLSVTSGIGYLLLEWTANTETDLDHYEIWKNTVNNSGTATKLADGYQTILVDGALTVGLTYYYWIKAVDHLSNTSSFSTVDSGAVLGVTSDDITSISASKVLIDGAVYLSNWRHSTDATKIDGANVYTGTITASKIAAGTITSNELATNSIVADKITANSITTTKINNSAVSTAKIEANAATVPVSGYNSGTTNGTSPAAWTTATSVSITTTGGVVNINISTIANTGGSYWGVRILRGETEIFSTGTVSYDNRYTMQYTPLSFNYQETPSAGTYTYYLQVWTQYSYKISQITVTEYKR